ncbi:MAG TPA: hypothetical protein VJC05_01975 [Candidatus Andersenbacteria bacterium]|nr:hypothetical protein [Candidatus Andersenbacteria bacterium]
MKFTKAQQQTISSIFAGMGHVFLASLFLPYLIDSFQPGVAILGLIEALAAWALSVILAVEV